MKVIVCPDSFKGTLTARQAAEVIREGLIKRFPGAEVVMLPVGDGGEGTIAAVAPALGEVETVSCLTVDPLRRPLTASYLVAGCTTALIESAAASGLPLVRKEERDIMRADTYGTGLLIADAYRRGIRSYIIGMGGTATCDGGLGAYEAMRDVVGEPVDITLLCDVDNPLCGSQGAAAVFGPQKGAAPQMIPVLDRRLAEIARRYARTSGCDVSASPFAGAAGGLAAMLMACYGARPVRGIGKVLKWLDFDRHLQGASMVITGEGRADATTLRGKAPKGILDAARLRGVPVMIVAGCTADEDRLLQAGFCQVMNLNDWLNV